MDRDPNSDEMPRRRDGNQRKSRGGVTWFTMVGALSMYH